MSNRSPSGEPVLCYVQHPWAYFTHAPLDAQWGDDWNDAPYEHNAGEPNDCCFDGKAEIKSRIVKVAFEANLETPADRAEGNNSRFSVEDINSRKIAWLQSPGYSSHFIAIMAGTPISEFKQMIRSFGGRVYVEELAQLIPSHE